MFERSSRRERHHDYAKATKKWQASWSNFPSTSGPAGRPIIVANREWNQTTKVSSRRNTAFMFRLSVVDDPVKARDLSPVARAISCGARFDMIALFAPELVKDSRTVPVVCQQIDWSAGGDGVVARGEIRSINDFRIQNGKRKKVVLAQIPQPLPDACRCSLMQALTRAM